MTYKRLYEDALFKLEHNKITLGEFEEMIKPLEREVEQEPTTKNNLGVDCVSRKEVFETIDDCNSDGLKGIFCSYDDGERFKEYIKNLPSVTPQEPILDKIRAEIKGMTPTYHNSDWSITDLVPISEVLKRIDKYKAESEG